MACQEENKMLSKEVDEFKQDKNYNSDLSEIFCNNCFLNQFFFS